MKLTYWVAECQGDSDCYSIRAKSKKECLAILADGGYKLVTESRYNDSPETLYRRGEGMYCSRMAIPHKVEVEYADGFDLLRMCMSEGRVYEGVNQ